MTDPLLEVVDLGVSFRTDDGPVQAVRGVNLSVEAGQVLAVVGESGSGKSVTAMSLLQLLPPTAEITGRVTWQGEDLLTVPPSRIRQVRGGEISMIFQDPLTALNPVYRVGDQIVEMIQAHEKVSRADARRRAVEMLDMVGIPQPDRRVDQYTHEFSGGMRQRAMIAMALANNPDVLIADEPTTALDVTVQAQILEVFQRIQSELQKAVVMITHDLGVIARVADRVQVMYAGRAVERAGIDDLFATPTHPYARGLLASLPRAGQERLQPILGSPPNMLKPPPGCAFAARCKYAEPKCSADGLPELVQVGASMSACVRVNEIDLREEVPA